MNKKILWVYMQKELYMIQQLMKNFYVRSVTAKKLKNMHSCHFSKALEIDSAVRYPRYNDKVNCKLTEFKSTSTKLLVSDQPNL